MKPGRGRALQAFGLAALLTGLLLIFLSEPGKQVLGDDPRSLLCGQDCFPVAHPWLLMLGMTGIVGGLVSLKIALRRALR